jgi:hypothetical protein
MAIVKSHKGKQNNNCYMKAIKINATSLIKVDHLHGGALRECVPSDLGRKQTGHYRPQKMKVKKSKRLYTNKLKTV